MPSIMAIFPAHIAFQSHIPPHPFENKEEIKKISQPIRAEGAQKIKSAN